MSNKIPGIHNYCDSWCERCSFTSQCAVYTQQSGLGDEEKDIKNKAFWDRLANNLDKAMTLLQNKATEMGIDLDEISAAHEQSVETSNVNSHPLIKIVFDYTDLSQNWLKKPGIHEKTDQLLQQYELGLLSDEDTLHEVRMIKDSIGIINWYETLVPSKLMRAIKGKDDDGWEKQNGYQRDYDGSAKIALMGIERAKKAWAKLLELVPQEEDNILAILAILEKMQRMTRQEFPEAEKFIRPGFDE